MNNSSSTVTISDRREYSDTIKTIFNSGVAVGYKLGVQATISLCKESEVSPVSLETGSQETKPWYPLIANISSNPNVKKVAIEERDETIDLIVGLEKFSREKRFEISGPYLEFKHAQGLSNLDLHIFHVDELPCDKNYIYKA